MNFDHTINHHGKKMKFRILAGMVLVATAGMTAEASPRDALECASSSSVKFSDALTCYHDAIERQPLVYNHVSNELVNGVERRNYLLTSQEWSPEGVVQPALWKHDVAIYIPKDALRKRALLISTNGTRHASEGSSPEAASELTPEALAMIATRTRTVVIALSDIPNQYLTYSDDGKPRREDDSVAHTWARFLQSPEQRKTMPLHVPMSAAIARAMSLAERELGDLQIHQFVLAGASKRGWASWHALIADRRVDAVVPIVIDFLNMGVLFDHIRHVYGGNWPVAFYSYVEEGITKQLDSSGFANLLQLQDPFQYLNSPYRDRLARPKYIINASGDDFFVPDGSQFYYDNLPGSKALRIVPNTSHYGIRPSIEDSLVTFINRMQKQQAVPVVTGRLNEGKTPMIDFSSSERPETLRLWSSSNPDSRDFRYACGVRFKPTELPTSSTRLRVPVSTPDAGWAAYFVEATFKDGFVATSQAYILGKQKYSIKPPADNGAACRTLP